MSKSSMTENLDEMDISPESRLEKDVEETERVDDDSKSRGRLLEAQICFKDTGESENGQKHDELSNDEKITDHEKKSENDDDEGDALIQLQEDISDPDEPEVGIVGHEATAQDILHDDELNDEDGVLKDIKDSKVAKWIEESSSHKKDSGDPEKNVSKGESVGGSFQSTRSSQRIITSIIKRSIKCLNKMHSMDNATTSIGNNVRMEKTEDKRGSSQVPQSRQNGAALPEETATPTGHIVSSIIKKESPMTDEENDAPGVRKKKRNVKDGRKRRSTEEAANGNAKRICFEQRERFIDSLVGSDRISTAEELASRADELVAEVKALDDLARTKEMEWNEILSMRKLKEEAYLRLERRRQVLGFLESNQGQISDSLPPASLSLVTDWEDNRHGESSSRERQSESVRDKKRISRCRLDVRDENDFSSELSKRTSDGGKNIIEKYSKKIENRTGESNRRRSSTGLTTAILESNLEGRQIGEGRQGPIVDVRSIIADYRLRHPEGVPRRGRRMRKSVNVGLGAGGAMVETGHADSRPSSTDSCKSGPTNSDPMSFKDVLVQFAKLSQQQGEPVKTPQNYPDVTLHPVAPSPVSVNSPMNSGQGGSLLHGILTKNQNLRPTTFSPTLARLLTAPERERSGNNGSGTTPIQSGQVSQHLLQTYQGNNSVSISDLLSSSKTRTEITITPVVNTTTQTLAHSNNNIVHVDDGEENHLLPEERDSRRTCSSSRDNREDVPPRCQGCNERAAQFVCAGCGNQWYCSRECQVSAWDEHSEVCSG